MTEQTFTKDQIEETLKKGVFNFKYTKKDGTERIASGTRNMEFIKAQGAEPTGRGTQTTAYVNYYDLGKEAWRCFDPDKFICFL
jgi:hypothetical protein